jgi:hypothetical protein
VNLKGVKLNSKREIQKAIHLGDYKGRGQDNLLGMK